MKLYDQLIIGELYDITDFINWLYINHMVDYWIDDVRAFNKQQIGLYLGFQSVLPRKVNVFGEIIDPECYNFIFLLKGSVRVIYMSESYESFCNFKLILSNEN